MCWWGSCWKRRRKGKRRSRKLKRSKSELEPIVLVGLDTEGLKDLEVKHIRSTIGDVATVVSRVKTFSSERGLYLNLYSSGDSDNCKYWSQKCEEQIYTVRSQRWEKSQSVTSLVTVSPQQLRRWKSLPTVFESTNVLTERPVENEHITEIQSTATMECIERQLKVTEIVLDGIIRAAIQEQTHKFNRLSVQRLQFTYNDCSTLLTLINPPRSLAVPVTVDPVGKKFNIVHIANTCGLERMAMFDPERNIFNEEHGKVLAVSMLSAIEYLHKKGIVHGRLQPGSIDISNRGYPMLMKTEKAIKHKEKSVPYKPAKLRVEYTCPEILRSLSTKSATPASDIFSLGSTVAWMIQGSTPYRGDDIEVTQAQLLDLQFPPHFNLTKMSYDAAEFVKNCVIKCPNERKIYTVSDLYEDSWFEDADYVNTILAHTATSPFLEAIEAVKQIQVAVLEERKTQEEAKSLEEVKTCDD